MGGAHAVPALSVSLVLPLLDGAARAHGSAEQAPVLARCARLLRSKQLARALTCAQPPPQQQRQQRQPPQPPSLDADVTLAAMRRVLSFATNAARDGVMMGVAADALCLLLKAMGAASFLPPFTSTPVRAPGLGDASGSGSAPAPGVSDGAGADGRGGGGARRGGLAASNAAEPAAVALVSGAARSLLADAMRSYGFVKKCRLTSPFWAKVVQAQPALCWQLMVRARCRREAPPAVARARERRR